jgi:hypothetical protein
MTTPTTFKVDDEIKPTVEALHQETERLLSLAKEIYIPSKVADTVIGETLPVHQQLLLYVVSAHVALSSMFCRKKLANEPIPEKLTQQIMRVQGYLKKLKEHGIDLNQFQVPQTAAVAANNKITGSRRTEREPAIVAQSGQNNNNDDDGYFVDTETSNRDPDNVRRRKIDPKVAERVGKLAQQGTVRRDV